MKKSLFLFLLGVFTVVAYGQTTSELLQKAESGDVDAQNKLGKAYCLGENGFEKNYEEAVKWFSKAADKGYAKAQNNLALCYANGNGVEKDMTQAVTLWKKAAKKDMPQAQVALGLCYANGDGIKKDIKRAVSLWEKAAEQGYARANLLLSECYAKGNGVEKNSVKAIALLGTAAEQGDKDAQFRLGTYYENGDFVMKDMSKAISWYKKAAEQGQADAQCSLAYQYLTGKHIAKDVQQAVSLWGKAAEKGNAVAQYNLGVCYEHGNGVEKDLSQAAYLYNKSAEQGYTDAQCALAKCYYSGNGVNQDYLQALNWFRKSAEQGNAISQYFLGNYYFKGDGVEQSFEQSFSWWKKSAEQGYAFAQYQLSLCYKDGIGVEKDLAQADYWYNKAKEQGYDAELYESLKPVFDACYNEEKDVESLLLDSKVKKRIIANYSQQYYDKLLEICKKTYPKVLNSLEDLAEISEKSYPVLYDSLENYFHAYAWKDKMFESKNKFVLRYYPSEDLLTVNLTIDGLEIDKSGFSDYSGWNEHPKQVLPFITQRAEQGYATAQLILALYYAGGFDGVDANNDKCFMWAQKSATQGNSSAQFILGKCYELGLGTAKDGQKAVEWMTKAASLQNVTAIDCLAGYYAQGEIVQQDYGKVVDLYMTAAYQDMDAMFLLGNIFWDSKFVESDKQAALYYLTFAGEHGNVKALLGLAEIYMEGKDIVPQDYSKSLYWLTKAAEQGDADIQLLLASIYMQDAMPNPVADNDNAGSLFEPFKKLVAKDVKRGLMWLIKSAENGHITAQRNLAIFYHLNGNAEEAAKWFRKTEEQGDDLHIIYGY